METIKTIAIESYVAEVSRLAKTGKSTEHTFRVALAALIDALAPGLKVPIPAELDRDNRDVPDERRCQVTEDMSQRQL